MTATHLNSVEKIIPQQFSVKLSVVDFWDHTPDFVPPSLVFLPCFICWLRLFLLTCQCTDVAYIRQTHSTECLCFLLPWLLGWPHLHWWVQNHFHTMTTYLYPSSPECCFVSENGPSMLLASQAPNLACSFTPHPIRHQILLAVSSK